MTGAHESKPNVYGAGTSKSSEGYAKRPQTAIGDSLGDAGGPGGELQLFDTDPYRDAARMLHERFIVPPFSVLDASQGYWQKRKRNWLSLGIKSELGRGDVTLVVGAEREGLPAEVASACDETAHIPIASHSLNAAMAATIGLYELTRVAPG